jgi:DNA-binding HxlR family transcriptional regulator
VGELLAMLGQPHMLDILYLFHGPVARPLRFSELQQRLAISPKTLSQRLKTLVVSGLLTRRAFNEIPPRVEYEPTAKTYELNELFGGLQRWAGRHSLRTVPSVAIVGKLTA